MSEWAIFRLGLAVWALGAATITVWVATLTPGNLARREKLPRWRWCGVVLGAVALALTVPQAQAILWDWLLPYYIPGMAVFLALCAWRLDYLMARALAGLFMLGAYYYLYYSFALNCRYAAVGAVLAWMVGALGVLIAGKPCWMRDWIRWCARKRAGRLAFALFFLLTGIIAVGLSVLGGGR